MLSHFITPYNSNSKYPPAYRPGFVDAVQGSGAKLSMDGKGAWRDKVFVEWIWRSVKYKYERVYLRAYASVREARADIAKYIHD